MPFFSAAAIYCATAIRSEEHTSELQSHVNLVCRLLLEKNHKLLKSHLFIFALPIAYAIGYIPYTIVVNTKNPASSYFQCVFFFRKRGPKDITPFPTPTPFPL